MCSTRRRRLSYNCQNRVGGVSMKLWQRLFHRCGENLEYIEGTRFPKDGTTGRGKVWKNYIHRVELNCVGLTFLMQLQLKEMLADIIIKAMKE